MNKTANIELITAIQGAAAADLESIRAELRITITQYQDKWYSKRRQRLYDAAVAAQGQEMAGEIKHPRLVNVDQLLHHINDSGLNASQLSKTLDDYLNTGNHFSWAKLSPLRKELNIKIKAFRKHKNLNLIDRDLNLLVDPPAGVLVAANNPVLLEQDELPNDAAPMVAPPPIPLRDDNNHQEVPGMEIHVQAVNVVSVPSSRGLHSSVIKSYMDRAERLISYLFGFYERFKNERGNHPLFMDYYESKNNLLSTLDNHDDHGKYDSDDTEATASLSSDNGNETVLVDVSNQPTEAMVQRNLAAKFSECRPLASLSHYPQALVNKFGAIEGAVPENTRNNKDLFSEIIKGKQLRKTPARVPPEKSNEGFQSAIELAMNMRRGGMYNDDENTEETFNWDEDYAPSNNNVQYSN